MNASIVPERLIATLSGFFGGKTDTVLMRTTDYFLVIPDLEKLLAEDPQWHFPQAARDKITGEITRMARGEYLP